jgi:hypothetical protein
MTRRIDIERNIGLSAETSFIPEGEDKLLGCRSSVDPRVNGEIIFSDDQVGTRCVDEYVAAAVEIERLPDLARRITLRALPRTIVVVLMIVGGAIAGPPILQVSGRRHADSALAGTARVNDCLNLGLRERAIGHFYFIDEPMKRDVGRVASSASSAGISNYHRRAAARQ